ncbi:hypothetical protein BJ684DRAFT_21929 [Piptocephalis cylindrospora]|uniref:Uncharacterized protein n=1 Tax=Piptocephalis cylindrospora TaxID=1907219 RepID=A0A4P9XYM5_9FUNG|nr:hypothetical protein BJ684DRAFT_21929 [Piptocephalis cylindrospora]|eukprot:RKP11497.1 hypothetical protein BJ684DRAFT_21929 [Piptocephalis cylindrospora]
MPLPNQATHWSNMPNSPPLQPGAQMPALGVNPIGGWRPLPPANQANAAQTGLTKTEQAAAQQAAERQVGQSALKPARALTEKVKPFEKNDGIFSGLTTSKELTDLASMGKLRLLKDTPTGQAIQMKPGDPIPHGSNVLAVSETGKVGRFSINEAGNIVPEASGRVSSSAQKELLKGQGIVPANAGGSSTSVGKGLLIGGGGVLTGAGVVGLSQLGNNNHGSNQGNWQGQNQGLNGGGRNGGIVDQAGLNGASNGQV